VSQTDAYVYIVFDGCIKIRNIIYQHYASVDKELNSYWVAKFVNDFYYAT